MRIFFEKRELFYVDTESDNFEDALVEAQTLWRNENVDFWSEADETGSIDIVFFEDEETSVELDNMHPRY